MPLRPRKRSKPNPLADTEAQSSSLDGAVESRPGSDTVTPSKNQTKPLQKSQATNATEDSDSSEAKKTWYGGTWPRTPKATPVTQVAKERISAAGAAATGAISTAQKHAPPNPSTPLRPPSLYLSRNIGSSNRSLPLAATTTKVNIISSAVENGTRSPSVGGQLTGTGPKQYGADDIEGVDEDGRKIEDVGTDTRDKSSADRLNAEDKQGPGEDARGASSGWMGWFARPVGNQVPISQTSQQATKSNEAQSSKTDIQDNPSHHQVSPHNESNERRASDPNPVSPMVEREQAPRPWLGLWGSATQPSTKQHGTPTTDPASVKESTPSQYQNDLGGEFHNSLTALKASAPEQPADARKSSGWAFWSRAHSIQSATGDVSQLAKSASAGTPSQVKPNHVITVGTKALSKSRDGGRSQPVESSQDTMLPSVRKSNAENTKFPMKTPSSVTMNDAPQGAKTKQKAINLLLPSFEKTYRLAGRPGILQQLGRLLQYTRPSSQPKHVDLLQEPVQIKKALAIGVHGYFPAPLIRSVLGQPTGTSMRFANGAASAIQAWTAHRGYSCEIEKIALEGEGRIAERLDVLWKLLLNWMEDIRKADFVMIACHSQGVPVAMMLIAKLIAFGCVNTARIGVCAMAGVNLGPFGDYKSRWISGSAGELFDFAQSDSQVSKDYEAALSSALRFGVRILCVGSIDDQLVSLESSTFGAIDHPYIFRAVFIDGRLHTPDFLSHLVGFALKLRNLGISDHGLIRELSTPLAGSLYGGEGHSRLYDDDAVYYLAIQHALETTSLGDVPLQRHRDGPVTSQNPYILPFAMRGLLEEEYVRTELYDELTELLEQFEVWRPSSKVLKDVKFRLEGVRFKL